MRSTRRIAAGLSISAAVILLNSVPASALLPTRTTKHTNHNQKHKLSNVILAATITSAPSNLAVSLDRPLLSPIEYSYRSPSSRGIWTGFLSMVLNDVCKTALVAFVLALVVTVLPKFMSKFKDVGTAERIRNAISRFVSNIQSKLTSGKSQPEEVGTAYTSPMPFSGDGGWGKATLQATYVVGSFTVYEFRLPKSHYTVPLALGQQLDFCCLSSKDDICTGSFYPFEGNISTGPTAGVVRVVLPNDEKDEGNAKFMGVLRKELQPGEEVAIKPGKSHLTYHGKQVPVTDMVYLASELGIVPVLDQIRAISPKGSSSVKVSSVIWMNDKRGDFDLAMDDLEREYMKYSTKLAVSCIMDDQFSSSAAMEGNREVEEAVPYFNPGTMAVVSGPKRFAEKASGYLMKRGYPQDCICVLP